MELPYDRARAVAYAKKWALSRNPLFYDFAGVGGDCTNFVSQCIYAGCGIMNYTPTYGWFYITSTDRAPAWSGVEELYRFLTEVPEFRSANGGSGPYAQDARTARSIELGDVVQLQNEESKFYHTLIITGFTENDILVSAHTNDALDRPLSSYNYAALRILHILGARLNWDPITKTESVFEGTALPFAEHPL
ncbi:MAG: amidase domain-containing protein [Clostridia bacterium]|nr:amidase domain-containing protein [Clostridia bacterium]